MSACVSRPTPTISTTDATISATTNAERTRSMARLVPPLAPSFKCAPSAFLHTRNAGSSPNASPVAVVNTSAPSNMRTSSAGASAIGNVVGTSLTRSGSVATPIRMPSIPPQAASTRLSVSIWRTRRSTLAPIAARIANSGRRASARDISRFARLVHAISSTQMDALTNPISSMRGCCET
jgi:hypothetical protein